jgi:hypothetical protein
MRGGFGVVLVEYDGVVLELEAGCFALELLVGIFELVCRVSLSLVIGKHQGMLLLAAQYIWCPIQEEAIRKTQFASVDPVADLGGK